MPHGHYEVWAGVDGQPGQQWLTVEVVEVNAQMLLDVLVSAVVAGVTLGRGNALFLPLVTSAD